MTVIPVETAPARGRIAVLLLALVLFGFNIWAYDLWAPDEPFFGEGAREMLADGQWLVVHVNGQVNLHKPPLFFWMVALLSAPFGEVSSWAARLPSVLAGLGSVALVMRLARRAAGERTALLAGVVFATAWLPWDKARSCQIDALLCFFVLAALAVFDAWRAGTLEGRRAGIAFWALGGLATLAKGPVGILLPVGIALVTLAVQRDLRAWRRFAPWLGPLAFVVVAGAWALPVTLWGGDYSLWDALKTHFFGRALRGMHHKNPPWYYLTTIPYQFMPWTGLLPGALLLAWRRRSPWDRMLLGWVVFVVLFFSVSGERRDLYMLPALPALALLAARFAGTALGWDGDAGAGDRAAGRTGARVPGTRWITVPQGILGVFLVAVGIAAPIIAPRKEPVLAQPAIALAVVLVATGLALVVLALRGRARAVLAATAAGFAVALLTIAAIYPVADRFKSSRPFAQHLARATAADRAAGGRVAAYRLGNVPGAIAFYSGVYTQEIDEPQELAAHLAREGAWAAVDLKQVPPQERARFEQVGGTYDLSRMDVALVRAAGAP